MQRDESLSGRCAVVTGATSGIGQETAVGLAARGADVVLIGRDPSRAEAARADVIARSGSERISVALADFASLEAVRHLGEELTKAHEAIHLLINNAGVVMTERTLTRDGHETTLGVNHLAPFVLTRSLERPLRAGNARIVNVSSEAHRFAGAFDFDDPMSEHKFGFPSFVTGMRVYGQSKLANLLFNTALARRLEGTGITTHALHPGAVATRLGQNNGLLGKVTTLALRPFFLSPTEGAATSLYCATDASLAGQSGGYFADSRPKAPTPHALDAEAADRLWRESCAWVGEDGDTTWST
ncbi:MAG: SDR family oxidoreductase [Myxococcota bacterium]